MLYSDSCSIVYFKVSDILYSENTWNFLVAVVLVCRGV